MPGTILWQSGPALSFSPQLSGQGEQITNGSRVLCSGLIYNDGRSGGLCLYGNLTLTASASGFGAAVQNQQNLDLYLVPLADGTTPSTAATSGLPPASYQGSFITPVSGNVSRLQMDVQGVPLLPVPYQTWLQNNTGQTLTSGWSLDFNGYQQAYT